MEFRMLGPLEFRGDDGPVPLRGRHHPKLLALLLDEAGRVVPVDRLTTGLWEDCPPESARQQIQNVVAGLRRQLGPAGARLRTVGYGYQIDIDTGELDVLRCKARASSAQRLRAGGRLEAAAAELRAALGEWRGPALAGMEGRMVESAARRLEEYRLALLEKRIDLELDLGADDGLIAELRQLTTAEPFRQRFTEQLMTALHRSGRSPESLQVYTEFSARLADALGVDPGPSLRHLHTAILRDDSGPALARPAAADRPRVVPALLPAGIAAFTGRDGDIDTLDALLDDATGNAKLVAVTGTGGVGKTTLAVHWSHSVADRFPDGQLFIDLRGFDPHHDPLGPEAAVRLLLDALGVPHERVPADPQAQFGLYRTMLADRRTLIVLDNAADSAQCRPLIPGGRGNLTLVTSRNPLHGLVAAQGASALPLRELSADEAHALLERRLGKEALASAPEAAERIIERCARLPLALALAAARASVHPRFGLAALARELEEAGAGLDAFAGDDPATDIRVVFACSYRALSAEAARMFRLLGLHPGPDLTAPAAASLAAVPLREARRSLAELTGTHLLTEHEAGRFTFHDLLRAHAAELVAEVDDKAERYAATGRMLDHYAHSGFHASRTLKPDREPITLDPAGPGTEPERFADLGRALDWIVAERRTLLAALDLAVDLGRDAMAWRIAWVYMEFAYRQGHAHDGLGAQRTALEAARRQHDVPGQIYSHRMVAASLERLGDRDQAYVHLELALDLCERTSDRLGTAQVHLGIGELHGRWHRYEDAVRHGRQSLGIAREIGNVRYEARALNFVGWFCAKAGHHAEALEYCERSLELHTEVGARLGQSTAWDSIGCILRQQGRPLRAVECFRRSLELSRGAGSRRTEAEALDHLGDAHRDLGDRSAAAAAWRQALEICDELGSIAYAETIREKAEQAEESGRGR